jgi:hypothetical protein
MLVSSSDPIAFHPDPLQCLLVSAQTVSASTSCSEQAWSEYDFVHSRRRDRLTEPYASMLVRVGPPAPCNQL